MTISKQVVLSTRPNGQLTAENFSLVEKILPELQENQFLIRNLYLSLDAGFRQWMNAGASDNYLSEMPLGQAVQSIVLGKVEQSNNRQFPEGCFVMGRTAWEAFSIADGNDLMTIIAPNDDIPLYEHLAALGPSGMTAFFGLFDLGHPKSGDILLVSAAAGGVGSLVGQLGKISGCTTIGISSSTEKCEWLKSELGYDYAINYNDPKGVSQQITEIAPQGVDIFYDNVGGSILDTSLNHLKEKARVILCGAISQYEKDGQHTGIHNLWQLVTKRARAEGFMFSDYVDQYPQAIDSLSAWISAGTLKSPLNITEGIERTAETFCKMLNGHSRGKCLMKLS